ncbi:hypothetical protein F4808DRAFT_226021 [Astrocystis sublimbata]|nr:hypothetical protein F4808DRAFT_226021 [Astrocystis sublimbata]
MLADQLAEEQTRITIGTFASLGVLSDTFKLLLVSFLTWLVAYPPPTTMTPMGIFIKAGRRAMGYRDAYNGGCKDGYNDRNHQNDTRRDNEVVVSQVAMAMRMVPNRALISTSTLPFPMVISLSFATTGCGVTGHNDHLKWHLGGRVRPFARASSALCRQTT